MPLLSVLSANQFIEVEVETIKQMCGRDIMSPSRIFPGGSDVK
jgi:hypothetical protein